MAHSFRSTVTTTTTATTRQERKFSGTNSVVSTPSRRPNESPQKAARRRYIQARLLAYREDLAHWFSSLFDLPELREHNFLSAIETGGLLCQLAKLIESKSETKSSVVVRFNKRASKGNFFARDNVATFLSWCRSIGIHEPVMFETDDLVEHKNEKQVLYCLLELARHQMVLPPPMLVDAERKILSGQLEHRSAEEERALLSEIVSTIEEQDLSQRVRPERVGVSQYKLNGQGPFYIVKIREKLMIQNDNHWDIFGDYLANSGVVNAKLPDNHATPVHTRSRQNSSEGKPPSSITLLAKSRQASPEKASVLSTLEQESIEKLSFASKSRQESPNKTPRSAGFGSGELLSRQTSPLKSPKLSEHLSRSVGTLTSNQASPVKSESVAANTVSREDYEALEMQLEALNIRQGVMSDECEQMYLELEEARRNAISKEDYDQIQAQLNAETCLRKEVEDDLSHLQDQSSKDLAELKARLNAQESRNCENCIVLERKMDKAALQNANLKKDIRIAKEHLENSEKDLKALTPKHSAAMEEIARLKARLLEVDCVNQEDVLGQLDDARRKAHEYKFQLDNYEDTQNELREDLEDQLAKLKKELIAANGQVNLLEDRIGGCEDTIEDYKIEKGELEDEIARLKSVQESPSKKADKQAQITELSNHNRRLDDELEKKNDEIERLNGEFRAAQALLAEKPKTVEVVPENAMLRSEFDEEIARREKAFQVEIDLAILQTRQSAIEEYERSQAPRNAALRESQKEMEDKLQAKQEELDSLEGKFAAAATQIQNRLQVTEEEAQDLLAQIEELKNTHASQIASLEREVAECEKNRKEDFTAHKAHEDELQGIIARLKAELQESSEGSSTELEILRAKLKEAEEANSTATSTIQKLNTELTHEQLTSAANKEEAVIWMEKYESLLKETEAKEASRESTSPLKSELERLREYMKRTNEDLDKSKEQLKQYKITITEKHKTELVESSIEWETKLELLRDEHAEKEQQSQDRIADLEKQLEGINGDDADVAALKAEIARLQALLEEANRSCDCGADRLKKENEELRARLKALEDQKNHDYVAARSIPKVEEQEEEEEEEEEVEIVPEPEEKEEEEDEEDEEDEEVDSGTPDMTEEEFNKEMANMAVEAQDLADWFNTLMPLREPKVQPETLFKDLETGELLCELADVIDGREEAARAQEEAGTAPVNSDDEGSDDGFTPNKKHDTTATPPQKTKHTKTKPKASPRTRKKSHMHWRYRPPVGVSVLRDYIRGRGLKRPMKWVKSCKPGSGDARRNINTFISWTRTLGYSNPDLFTARHIMKRQNPRRVIYGLFDVARRTRNMSVPHLVWLERRKRLPGYHRVKGNAVDEAVYKVLQNCLCQPRMHIRKVGTGKYVIGRTSEKVYSITTKGNNCLVRVGGGYEELSKFMTNHDQCRVNVHLQKARTHYEARWKKHAATKGAVYKDSEGVQIGLDSTLPNINHHSKTNLE